MLEISDEKLVSAYLKGNGQAFELLVQRYFSLIYRLCLHYTGAQAEAEDITQEVFLKAWRFLSNFNLDRSFKTWLLSIARNACIDFLRKKRPLAFASLREDQEDQVVLQTPDPEPLPEEMVSQGQAKELIYSKILQLSEKYRTVVLLRLQEDLSFKEIAEVLDEPVDTVKSRYRRALLMLREGLEAEF